MESLKASKKAFQDAAAGRQSRPKSLAEAKNELFTIEKQLDLPPIAQYIDQGDIKEGGKALLSWVLQHEPQKLIINAFITISTRFLFSHKR